MGNLALTIVQLYERLRRIPKQSRRGQEPISTPRLATSMSALPILDVQQRRRVGLFAH